MVNAFARMHAYHEGMDSVAYVSLTCIGNIENTHQYESNLRDTPLGSRPNFKSVLSDGFEL